MVKKNVELQVSITTQMTPRVNILELFAGTRPCAQVPHVPSLITLHESSKRYIYCPHFIHKELEHQRV